MKVMDIDPEPKKKGGGWKSKLGSFLKGIAGTALGAVVTQLENIPLDLTTKTGAGIAIALLFVGDALKSLGQAHKQERTIEAVEDNTKAVKDAM